MHSIKRLPTILVWSICSFIIHLLINIIKNKDGKSRIPFLQRFIGELLEFVWYITTFLVIPVLAHENIGGLANIKKSAQLMKKTFGENLVATLLLPQLIGLIMLAWFLVTAGFAYIALTFGYNNQKMLQVFMYAGLPISGTLLIIAIILCIAVSAATTVFKTAAYHYATGSLIGPFSSQEVTGSFVPEKKK